MSKANPQLEDGYTRVANTLLEAVIAANIGNHETKVVLAIIRQTYGYQRKSADISLSVFVSMTKLDKRNISRALKNLINNDLIKRSIGSQKKWGKPVHNYQILKERWCQYDNSSGVNMTHIAGVNMTHIKEINKTLKKGRKQLVDNFTFPSSKKR